MTPNGNAIAVWLQNTGDTSQSGLAQDRICANRYVAGTGWGTLQTIEPGADYTTSENSDAPIGLAINANGNAVAVWSRCGPGGTIWNIWANIFKP